VTSPAVRYSIQGLSLKTEICMTYAPAKDRTGNSSQTYRSTGWNRLSGREKAASGSLHGLAR
jgi:hypothetical protein